MGIAWDRRFEHIQLCESRLRPKHDRPEAVIGPIQSVSGFDVRSFVRWFVRVALMKHLECIIINTCCGCVLADR